MGLEEVECLASPGGGGEVVVGAVDGGEVDGEMVLADVVAVVFAGGWGIGVGGAVDDDAGEVGAEVGEVLFGGLAALLGAAFHLGGLDGLGELGRGGTGRGGGWLGVAPFATAVGAAVEEVAEDDLGDVAEADVAPDEA